MLRREFPYRTIQAHAFIDFDAFKKHLLPGYPVKEWINVAATDQERQDRLLKRILNQARSGTGKKYTSFTGRKEVNTSRKLPYAYTCLQWK